MALSVIVSPGHATRVVRSKSFSRTYPVQKLLIVKLGGTYCPHQRLKQLNLNEAELFYFQSKTLRA